RGRGEAREEPVRLEGAREEPGPRVALPRLRAHLRHEPREVERELVRRCVLAGVEAGAAVVAEVAEVADVALGEGEAALQRREGGAVALAVAAGVADRQHA